MTTTVKRRATFNPVETFLQHLTLKHEGKTLTNRSESLKKRLKEWLPTAPEAYENDKGSKFVDLDEPVQVGGKTYTGMELRRVSGKVVFNEETAEKVLLRKVRKDPDIVVDASSSYIDQDKIARLHQEGRITDKELESMFETGDPTYAFWPVEGEILD